jgi:putative transposase
MPFPQLVRLRQEIATIRAVLQTSEGLRNGFSGWLLRNAHRQNRSLNCPDFRGGSYPLREKEPMAAPNNPFRRYPPAVRMVREATTESGERQGAVSRVAKQLGIGTESLRSWVKQADVDSGKRPGVRTAEQRRITELEARTGNCGARNEILKAAAGFFAAGARRATAQVVTFISAYRKRWGIEPVCKVPQVAPLTYYAALSRQPSARQLNDERLKPQTARVHRDNFDVYGIEKVWRQLNREGHVVGRDRVARFTDELNLSGVVRGKKNAPRTPADVALRPADLVERKFIAAAPNQLWVADLTYVSTWTGFVYVAFVIDVFSRFIVGWRVSNSLHTELALDALEMAIWRRQRVDLTGLIHHSDRGVHGGFNRRWQHRND